MILNTHPENRKEMVKMICELTGLPSTYMGMPSAAYHVGSITVSRDGTIDCEDEAMLSTLKPMLIERGWLEAEAQSEMPAEPESPADSKDMLETVETISVEQMDITMPIPGWTVAQMNNLLRILYSKQVLINRMLGCDMLSIEESFVKAISENPPESTVDLEARVQEAIEAGSICGFRLSDEQVTLSTPFAQDEPTRWMAYADLLKGMLRIAKTATRISIKRLDDPENEKYAGDLLLQKYYINNHIEKKQLPNRGELPQYAVAEDHEPIIDRATFDAVQKEIRWRSAIYAPAMNGGDGGEKCDSRKPDKSSAPAMAIPIICGICGKRYRRKITRRGTAYAAPVWICSTYNYRGKAYCASKQIPEPILLKLIATALGTRHTEDEVDHLEVHPDNRVLFAFQDGHVEEHIWKDHSRKDSWNTDKRKKAAEKTRAQHQRRREREAQ